MKKITTFIIIFVGASIGGSLRYLISQIMQPMTTFPWATLLVNLTGALFLPLVIHYLYDRYHLKSQTVFALTTGFLGAYTTFSTMAADTYNLYHAGNWWPLLAYLSLTMVGGFLCALLGNYLAVVFATNYYGKKK